MLKQKYFSLLILKFFGFKIFSNYSKKFKAENDKSEVRKAKSKGSGKI